MSSQAQDNPARDLRLRDARAQDVREVWVRPELVPLGTLRDVAGTAGPAPEVFGGFSTS